MLIFGNRQLLTLQLICRESLVIAAAEADRFMWNDPSCCDCPVEIRSTDLLFSLEEFSDGIIRPAVNFAMGGMRPIGKDRLTLPSGMAYAALERYRGIDCRVIRKYEVFTDQLRLRWDFEFPGLGSGWIKREDQRMPWGAVAATSLYGLEGVGRRDVRNPLAVAVDPAPSPEARPDDGCKLELDPVELPFDKANSDQWAKRELDL